MVPQLETAPPARARGRALVYRIAIAAGLTAFFLLLSWDTLRAPFAADEMMAIHWYWRPSPWRLLVSQFMLWVGYVRPFGAIFYLPPFLAFGLNPVPYHAYLLALLLAGADQMRRLARALGASELAAVLVALLACYHGGLANLYFNSVFVFDVMCAIFYFSALAYYARIRRAGRILTGRETTIFTLLYLCALNSKEMAMTMPVVLLAYEWLFHGRPPLAPRPLIAWLRGPGRAICFAGFLNVLSLWGKMFGRFGLMKNAEYRPVYSWARFLDFQERQAGDLFYHVPRLDWPMTLVVWLAVTYFAWRKRDPLLRFCWWFIVITPLPMEFLIGRDQACLYVCLAGWAILAARLFESFLPGAVRVLAAERLFGWLGPQRLRALLVSGVCVAYGAFAWSYKQSEIAPAISSLSPVTNAVVAEFRSSKPQVPSGSTVVFLDDPFAGFDMAFIADLSFRDRSTTVRLHQKTPQTPEEIASAGAVFTWRNERLVRVR